MERPTTSAASLSFLFICCFFCCSFFLGHQAKLALAQNAVDVGVVLDLQSQRGMKNWASISLAVDDFYAARGNVTNRVILHPRDSRSDVVGAASAALDLLKNVKVQAIIGPLTSAQTEFVANLGNRSNVPIISFSATSPSLSTLRTPYFVRANLNDSTQVRAIAAIIKLHGWREVVPIYEDTPYGSGIVPFLIDELNSLDARVPYRSVVPSNASDDWLAAELHKLMTMQTRVFVVHMMSPLGSRLFQQARAGGLMSAGYVWIVTDGVANALDTVGRSVLDSMEGVLGVRSYVPRSHALAGFTRRWRARFKRDNPNVTNSVTPAIYQLWAYDAAWAVAHAATKAGKLSGGFDGPPPGADNTTDLARLGVSKSGPKLLETILGAQFLGLNGDFRLVDGQLQSSAFEIVNVVGNGGWGGVGFWLPAVNLIKDLKNASDAGLQTVIWSGDSKKAPKGWQIPTMGKKLRIGVPRKTGFNEFVNVGTDQATGRPNVTGYCIDIFDAVVKAVPYSLSLPYEYVPYDADSYDALVSEVYFQRVDAVVGDTTIIANRSLYVDFTLPYTESGVSMVVPVKEDKSKNAWIFLKPLTTDLWLASLAFFFFTGFVVWVIEHRINNEFRGPPSQQMGTIFYFAFSTLVFAHRERLESNLSRFAVIIWVFVVLILTSSYTASLTSMLTVQQLQPAVTDLSELIKNGDYIGYQNGSFVYEFLKQQLKFEENKLKSYSTPDEYAQALSLGSKNGGVAAIFDEIPFLKLFLSQHCNDYAMVGPTYKTDGFGFVFPRGSPLVSDISRAVLNVTEGDAMAAIEKKWFGDQTTCSGDAGSLITSSRLNFRSFGGLFLITGCVSSLALLIFLITFLYKEWDELKKTDSQSSSWRRIVEFWRRYDRRDLSSHTFKDYATSMNGGGSHHRNRSGDTAPATPNIGEGLQSPVSVNFSDLPTPNIGEGSQSPVSMIFSDLPTPNIGEGSQIPVDMNFSDLNFGSPDVGIRSFREMVEPVIAVPAAEDAIEMVQISLDS